MAENPLAESLGIWLVNQLLQTLLYGAGLLQVYLYFFWYPKDRWYTKLAVILVTIFETGQIVFYFAASWKFFIINFGNFTPFSIVPWEAKVQLASLTCSTFVAQEYFAHTLYILYNRRILYPLFVALIGLASFIAGIVQVVDLFEVTTFVTLGKTSTALNAQAATAVACDFFITAGLCWQFNAGRSGIHATNKVINFLIMTAVNRGLFTMLFAILNIIFWFVKPTAFYFLFMNTMAGHLYMNSMLAILNTREHAYTLGQIAGNGSATAASNSMNLSTLRAAPGRAPATFTDTMDVVDITVANSTLRDGDLKGSFAGSRSRWGEDSMAGTRSAWEPSASMEETRSEWV